ncbi:MAG: hypothetical protein D6B27_08295 [Gammaproteobacteria bacterium]|nr:MAG: hypothetical protein D6B27_08295 [Gammaproteobacteria bacterium]
MKDENHRKFAIEIFRKYTLDQLNFKSYKVIDFDDDQYLPYPEWKNCVYVLRIGSNRDKHFSLTSIPNRNDRKEILYIGGHKSGKNTGRYNKLIKSAKDAEEFYRKNNYATNDMEFGHSVGSCLTTSLLDVGFSISDCTIDLIESGKMYDELELIIGYQETFHHLPPWNSLREGVCCYGAIHRR